MLLFCSECPFTMSVFIPLRKILYHWTAHQKELITFGALQRLTIFSGIYVIFIYITISIKFTNSSMFHDPSGLSSVGFVQRNTSFSSHDLNDDDWIVKTLITGNSSSKLADIYKVHDKNTPRRQYKQCCCNMQHIDPIVNQLDSSIAWMKTSAATNQPTNSSDLCI